MRFFVLMVVMAGTMPAQMTVIEGARIRPHVKFLSSDLLEGRGVGARGGQLAVEYIASQFAAAGLKPGAPDGSYLQKVPLRTVEVKAGGRLSAASGGKSLQFRWLEDFVGTSHAQEAAAAFDAPLVFVGHGIRAPEYKWDDYAGVDVKGKVVVLFTNEPPSTDPAFFQGKALTYYGRWTYKFEEAARQGAVGALIIHTDATASYGWQVVRTSNGRPSVQVRREAGQPALGFAGWLTTAAGNQLLGLAGKSVDAMLAAADKPGFRAAALGSIRLRGDFQFQLKDIETHNVVGLARGADPRLSEEAVVFSGHWDHLGVGEAVNGDSIYNGAIDNATGCAMLIEMARAWGAMEPKPLRSAYFVAVTAEESGLIGSKFFADHPPVPAAKIAADLNFDSYSPFGRVRDVVLTGAERTPIWGLVQSLSARYQLAIQPDGRPEAGSYYRSDHYSFARVGVPAFSINMGSDFVGKPAGFAEEKRKDFTSRYHQPTDEYVDDWDFSGLEQFGRFGFALGVEIANLPTLPARIEGK